VRRPTIGLTPDVENAGGGEAPPRYVLKSPYADAVLRAGGLPMVLPLATDPAMIDAYLDRISGLIVTGGAFDVPPEAYGESPREGLGTLKPGRTHFETTLLQAALKRAMPVLGVCGGMQLLNVVLGGTLFQDIQRDLPEARNHEQSHDRGQPSHPVEVRDGTVLAELVGRGQLMVNSTHHQAVSRLGEGLVASAVAPDGVVEAIESSNGTFAVGVQWHPELLLQSMPLQLGVYRGLITRARDTRR
jgi:putative glutamine amidotransferase